MVLRTPNKKALVMLAIGFAFSCTAGVVFWAFCEAEQMAMQTEALSRAKMLSRSLLAYAEDNDGYFPTDFGPGKFPKAALGPYAPHSDFELVTQSVNPRSRDWAVNTYLKGIDVRHLDHSDRTLVVFDSLDWPNGRRCAAFADGSAKRLAGQTVAHAYLKRNGVVE